MLKTSKIPDHPNKAEYPQELNTSKTQNPPRLNTRRQLRLDNMPAAMAFDFALPEQELEQLLGLSIFEKVLLSLLCGTLGLGVYLHQRLIGTAT
jgi:hypothetical protein